MATIDKLNYLNETKGLIKTSLNNLGAGITNDTTFREYVDKINAIAQEYPTEEQVQNIQLQNIQPLQQPLNIDLQPNEKNAQNIEEIVQNVEEINNENITQNEEVE